MTKAWIALGAAALAAGCSAPPDAATTSDASRSPGISAAPSATSTHARGAVEPDTIDNSCNLPANLLTYNGGPLLTSLYIVPINWNSNVDSKLQGLGIFYAELIGSSQWSWIASEYSTSNYKLWGWAVAPTVTLSRTETRITDADVRNALENGINNGTLPKTSGNGYSDGKTLYIVTLPPNTLGVDSDGDESCPNPDKTKNSWQGYHFFETWNNQKIYYAVIADTTVDCKKSAFATAFDHATTIATHEIFEAITDPEVGSGWHYNNWKTNPQTCPGGTPSEIGDFCNNLQGTIRDSDAQNGGPPTYTVQLQYDNRTGKCYDTFCTPLTCANLTNLCGQLDDGCGSKIDCSCPAGSGCGIGGQAGQCAPFCTGPSCFTISTPQPDASLPAGDTTSVPFTVDIGTCHPVSLTVSGESPGVSASVSQPTVNTSGSYWLYLDVDKSVPPEQMTITVTGTCNGGSQSTSVQLTTQACIPATSCNGACGTIDNGCGQPMACGGCASGQSCVDNQCVTPGGGGGSCGTPMQCCIRGGCTWNRGHCICI